MCARVKGGRGNEWKSTVMSHAAVPSSTIKQDPRQAITQQISQSSLPKYQNMYSAISISRQTNCTIFQKNVQNLSPFSGIPDAVVQSITPTPFSGIPDAIIRSINHSDSVTITPKRRTSQNKQANKGMGKDREVGVSKGQRIKGKKTIKNHQYQSVKQPPGLLSPTQR